MRKIISIYLLILFFYLNGHAQPGTFGYRISGDGDIISDVFIVQDGYVIDSVRSKWDHTTYQFEYDDDGRLKRDINFYRVRTIIYNPSPRIIFLPGSRDYYYNEKGFIDSIGYGHWDDDQWVSDSIGYKYLYSDEDKVISKIYSKNDTVLNVEEYIYDFDGRLIKSAVIDYLTKDILEIMNRKYDSMNRLVLRKYWAFNGLSNSISESHYIYQYDSSNNVNMTLVSIDNSDTTNWNFYFEFDEYGKAVYEIMSNNYSPEDSTWQVFSEISFNYDENGRMYNMNGYWCFYSTDGNIDSLINLHPASSGYLGTSATLLDSHGNRISIPNAFDCKFYL